MTFKISNEDKKTINLINDQVNALIEKLASDLTIVNTLVDFIPDVKCLLSGGNDKELDLDCKEYIGFSYFINLINKLESSS